ncbi:aspartic proteinase CDR1-like [Punica granatum]|uniref:Aspartic proteinase CDR1-like n=1 Tax=Punica granatum TaxID=22663 RepID=A0A6P8C628_PUNGR|nr:aspartic proteinase CDR1-like [Punica granatum]
MRYYQYRMTALRENVGLLDSSDMTLGLVASDAGVTFLASMSIGQPPIPQLLIVDTGSSLSWVQCASCRGCSRQVVPLFDPSKSSTYVDIPCTAGSQICGNTSG